MNDDEYLTPPNTEYTYINHPNGTNNCIEISLMQEHRFAFYFWFKWWKKSIKKTSVTERKPPALISIDWHRDLCPPCEEEIEDLKNLDLKSYWKTALFCWDKLNPLNDNHILSAAYLNLIGNIYVLCKQDDGANEPDFIDIVGNKHSIKCFSTLGSLYKELMGNDNIDDVYFDIDLDYFTDSKDPCGGGKDLTVMNEKDIFSLLNPESNFMKWIFSRMQGMTIATEPNFCGGLSNSNKIYSSVDKTLFNSQLFSNQTTWKHLTH